MDNKEEYHDPDYPGVSTTVKEEKKELTEEEKIEKVKAIIRREFSNELEIRENEVMVIEQRMSTSRRMLHQLRYALVSSYYRDQKLQLSSGQIEDDVAALTEPRVRAEMSTLLRDGQRRLHPSVRKLLGKKTVDLDEIFNRGPRNKVRKDYSAMVQARNYTIAADATKTLRPGGPEPAGAGARPKKTPRHRDPPVLKQNVVTLDEATRNKMKHRYRFIIGNTSKYAPPASRADRSTHKWLLYVRGPPAPARGEPANVLTRVVARLHHSYAPHHTVTVTKPPFHISRRGWGEFPAQIELHFKLPAMNRPVAVEHTIKLDRHYTGLQTCGAETIVDVWLYSTPEMLEYEYVDPVPTPTGNPPPDEPAEQQMEQQTEQRIQQPTEQTVVTKQEPVEYENAYDNWMDFFNRETELDVDEMIIKPNKKVEEKNDVESLIDANVISRDKEIKTEPEWTEETQESEIPTEILNQPPSPKKRIMKYIDSTTGKIYYLEMDRNLDLSKVQEIVINNMKVKISPVKSNGLKNVRKKKGVSLLKPEVKNQLKIENRVDKRKFSHIENDHCYLGTNWDDRVLPDNQFSVASVKKEKSLIDNLCDDVKRFTCVRTGVNYLLRKIPVVRDMARDPDNVRHFPFIVESEERYWKLDFAKRRNIEWSRAKLINKILTDNLKTSEQIWRTKQILVYSRLHGFQPIRKEQTQRQQETDDWSSWNDLENSRLESNIKELYPNATDINSLSVFKSEEFLSSDTDVVDLNDSDVEIDIVSDLPVRVKEEVSPDKSNSELTVLPVESDEDRLRFLFIEKKCAEIGIELRNEDVGNGYSYSAVHAVILSAVKCFAEELIRGALAEKITENRTEGTLTPIWTSSPWGSTLQPQHVWGAARSGGGGGGGGRLGALARRALAASMPLSHRPRDKL